MALKKKGTEAKAKNKRPHEDVQGEEKAVSTRALPAKASKKTAGKKAATKKAAAKKAAAKGDTNESKPKGDSRKRTIRVPVARVRGGMMHEQDPFELAKQTMKGAVPAIVKAMVEKAKQGSCSHAKTLLEMTGADHMFDGEAEAQNSGEPWAKLVLERLSEAESMAEPEAARLQEESLELVAE